MRSIILAAAGVLALAGCSSSNSPGLTSVSAPPTQSSSGVGQPTVFARKADGQRVGAVTVTDVVELPAGCVVGPTPWKQAVALRFEVVNDGELMLPKPDIYAVKVQDGGGFTQNVDNATISLACTSDYPEIASSQAPGRTSGWVAFETQPNPAAVVYAPYVSAKGSTIENIKFEEMSPAFATVKVPNPLPLRQPVATTAPPTTQAPAPTTTTAPPAAQPTKQAAPAAGVVCNPSVDNWAVDGSGGQLKCAYAGGSTPKWVESAPLVGTRTPGSACELGSGLAESPAGQTLVCVGDRGSATWTPGP